MGCPGALAGQHGACLRHLSEVEWGQYLAELGPGGELDLRGTEMDEPLLASVLRRFREGEGAPVVGRARCARTVFAGHAGFYGTVFAGDADFTGAVFEGEANFRRVSFGGVSFKGAVFRVGARFDRAVFRLPEAPLSRAARFDEAEFRGVAVFERALFPLAEPLQEPTFHGVVFHDEARFRGAVSHGGLSFARASFEGTTLLGPLLCASHLSLTAAHFAGPVVIEVVTREVTLNEARFEQPAVIAVRYGAVRLDRAVLLHPCMITTFTRVGGTRESRRAEEALAREHGPDPTVAVTSLRGVDAAMLLLADVDLTGCVFAGAHHLDGIRLEGGWRLGSAPGGVRWSRGVPRWSAKRQVIAEEREWRAAPGRRRASRHDWGPEPRDPAAVPGLATLTSTYRQLREAREDAKDEPGAADFYYGEMEMRRYGRGWGHAERWLLQAYWALSGYGLRASRALGWLVGAMLVTAVLMLAFGLPDTPACP